MTVSTQVFIAEILIMTKALVKVSYYAHKLYQVFFFIPKWESNTSFVHSGNSSKARFSPITPALFQLYKFRKFSLSESTRIQWYSQGLKVQKN